MKINSIAQSSMKSLKKLALGGLTLATLAMAVPQPAKADTVSFRLTPSTSLKQSFLITAR